MKPFIRILSCILFACILSSCAKFHSLMRAEPLPISNFLPNQHKLVKCPDTFPFHYAWSADNIRTPKYLRVAPVYTAGLRDADNWEGTNGLLGGELQDEINELADYMQQKFREELDMAFPSGFCDMTDDPKEKDCLVIETAIVALVPTQAVINVVGEAVGLFVPGVSFAASLISEGGIGVECRIRDAKTGKIVAMYATSECDEAAIVSLAKFTRLGSAKNNIDSIARMNAELFASDDPSAVKRSFPINLFAF